MIEEFLADPLRCSAYMKVLVERSLTHLRKKKAGNDLIKIYSLAHTCNLFIYHRSYGLNRRFTVIVSAYISRNTKMENLIYHRSYVRQAFSVIVPAYISRNTKEEKYICRNLFGLNVA